eukprot:8065-Eustigmatos_ZCMA.PRE.1
MAGMSRDTTAGPMPLPKSSATMNTEKTVPLLREELTCGDRVCIRDSFISSRMHLSGQTQSEVDRLVPE